MDSDFPHFNSSAQLPEGGVKQENVSESSSQLHDAMEALEAYQTAVCSELTEESVDASSKAISAAVKQLVAHHESEMQSLSHENAQLREQLSCASGLVDSLTAHLSLSTNATMRRSSALHTVAGSPDSSSHPSSLPPSSSSSVAPRPTRLAEDTDSTGHHSEQPALVDSPLSDTAAVAEDATEEDHVERLATLVDVALPTAELLTSEPGALEAFVAHYADLRGRVAHLLTEQRLWRHSLEQLTPLLRTMTVENANFRQTLTLLKATHVPIEALQEAVRERDEARRELRQLRLDAARLEHELADAEAQHSKQMLLQGQQQQGSAEALAAHKKSVSVSPAPEWPSAGVDAAASAPYPHDGEWAMAIRELEEQAIVAANQQLLRQQLADAQAETTRLQSENNILRDALTAAQAEEACLREDAQNAVFRNGVLSQQVTSLLVKVERLRQELRAAPARSQGTHKDPGSHTLPGQSPALVCGASPASPSPSTSSLSQRRPFTVPSEMQTQPRTGLRQHTVAWGGPRDAVNTSAACAAAVASQALLDRRSREGGSAWLLLNGSPSVLDRNASISNASPLSEPMHRLSTFTLRGTDAALQRPVRQTAVASAHAAEERSGDRVRDPFLSFSDGVVTPLSARDVGEPASAASFTRPAASSWSTLEVERGVSRTLRTLGRRTWTRSFAVDDTAADDSVCPNEEDGVNGSEVGQPRREASASSSSTAHRQRVCALRNLGSSVMEVSLPCVPRLPASDCLSGVALGRPSAYSVLDPRTGAVRRQLTSAEVTLRTQSGGSGASSMVNKASRAPASQAAIADEASSLPLVEESAEDVLAILDMLENEDLGGLERYSANTVSELVLRNQELLVQLYKTTQRAEEAEARERVLARDVHGDVPMHPKSLVSRGDGGAPQEQPQRLRGPRRHVAALEEDAAERSPGSSVGAGVAEKDGSTHVGVGAPSATEAAAPPHPGQKRSRADVPELAHSEADEDDDVNAKLTTATTTTTTSHILSDQSANLVKQFMNDVLERHDVAVAWRDECVASALIDVLQTMRPLQPVTMAAISSQPNSHTEASTTTPKPVAEAAQEGDFMVRADAAVSEAALHSVIALCAAQAVQLVQQDLEANKARTDAVDLTGWHAAQASLQAAITDLKATFIVPHEERLQAMQAVVEAMYAPRGDGADAGTGAVVGGGGGGPLAAAAENENGLLRVLDHLHKLLRGASRKDGSVMAALAASHDRQRALLRRRERKMRRLAHTQSDQGDDGAVGERSAVAGSPLLQPQHTPTTSMPSLIQPPPQLGSPGATRDIGPSRSPRRESSPGADTALAHLALLNRSGVSDDDDDDEDVMYAGLRDHLALEKAKQRKLSDELQAEKKLHLSLHERMWTLECERDDAVTKVKLAEEKMAAMLTRDEYENVVGDLDEAKQEIDDLRAQLRFLHQEKNRLQAIGDTLQHQLDHHEEAHQKATADSRLALQQRDQQLSSANELEYTLRREIAALQDHLVRHQEEARIYLEQLNTSEQERTRLGDEIESLRQQFLADDRTQALLRALYPGDTALEANAALIRGLRQEKHSLAGRLAAAELEIETSKSEQDRLRDLLQKATQERQEAELALQAERAARLGLHDDRTEANAADARTDDATMCVVPASMPALRRRVQSLDSQLATAQHEAELLRDAETAWKLREAELRRQLDVMSRDPISRAVRQYGLQACETFEEALEQMQKKIEEVTHARDAAQSGTEALSEALEAAKSEIALHTSRLALLEASKEQAQSELGLVQQQLTELRNTLAARETTLASMATQKAALEVQIHSLEGTAQAAEASRDALQLDLDHCETEKARFWEDNNKLMEKLKELQKDLTRLDAEKRAANAALAQGMHSASRQHGRHVRGGGGGSGAPARPSLTGDLSLTPITPPNQRIS